MLRYRFFSIFTICSIPVIVINKFQFRDTKQPNRGALLNVYKVKRCFMQNVYFPITDCQFHKFIVTITFRY
jgi:hypothetical protein